MVSDVLQLEPVPRNEKSRRPVGGLRFQGCPRPRCCWVGRLTSSPPQAARVPTASRFVFPEMASVGSSHNRSTSAEDHEEALLLGCPPIGRSGRRNMEQFGRKRKRGLISSA